jgi:Protein of unknown function (DUF3237)
VTRFAHNGLEVWYATPDAPAPEGTTEHREGISVTVGVRPASPAVAVRIRYRVDGRAVRTISAPALSVDFARRTRYFRAQFPSFRVGDEVEYLPMASYAGRSAPDPASMLTFPSSFRLSPATDAAPHRDARGAGQTKAAFPGVLEHLVHAHVPLTDKPEIVGQTPAGFVINWPPVSGRLDGAAFHAVVVPGGQHQTTIRSDGIGIVDASVSVRSSDHALIGIYHSGTVDYGEDWATSLAGGMWPPALPVRTHIRLLTAEPRYRWLNRLFCVSVGEVRPAERIYSYDLYAVR